MNLQTIKNRQAERGFTIVELLIVIVVIAILAAISIVAYTGVQDRARNSSAQQTASQVASKANAYYAVHGSYPVTEAQFQNTDVARLEGIDVEVALAELTGAPTGDNLSGWNAGTLVYYIPTGVAGTSPNQTATGYVVQHKDTAQTSNEGANVAGINRIVR